MENDALQCFEKKKNILEKVKEGEPPKGIPDECDSRKPFYYANQSWSSGIGP